MKIVYCIHSLCNSGGMERIITEKANAFAEIGHQVTILTAEQMNRSPFFHLSSSVSLHDLAINYSANKNILMKFLNYPFKIWKHRKRLSTLLMKIHPDITISTMGNEFLFLYKIKDGSKKILEVHFAKDYRLMRNRHFLWRFIDNYRSKQENIKAALYDKFVVLTSEDKDSWRSLDNIVVIPNFISYTPTCYADLNNKICLAVGRLSHQKGFDMLIKSWDIVHKKCRDWKLHIYGSGELYDQLVNMINELDLDKSIIIYPPTNAIKDVYLESSVMLMTSRYEGLPMVLLEAFSYGLPVVSFACKCGPRDLIENGSNGFLVPTGDIESFANQTILLLENESIRKEMGQSSFLSSQKYTKEIIINRWINLFNNLCTKS